MLWSSGRTQPELNAWLQQVLTKIDSGVDSLKQDMVGVKAVQETMRREHGSLADRVNELERLERNRDRREAARGSRWAGPRNVLTVIAAIVPIVYIINWLADKFPNGL